MANDKIDSDYVDAVKYFRTKCMDVRYMKEVVKKLETEGRMDKIVTMTKKYLRRGGVQEHELEKLPIIHIAGSKGKGSTSTLTESILRHHGYKTGMFVSPHFHQIRERICINGRPLSKEKFCLYFWDVFKKIENSVTGGPIEDGGEINGFFDTLLVMAFCAFISEGVDVVVLEVGKGGKADRTNFVRNPVVCGITPLALEHTRTLGSTIDKIAWHKAGIIKPGRPVITVPQKPEAMQVILDTAKANNSPVYIAEAMPSSLLTQYQFKLGLTGDVQLQNAGLAVHLFQVWKSWKENVETELGKIPSTIDEIPVLKCEALDPIVIKGLANCKINGRTQVVRSENVTYYLDFAHTEDSVKNLVSWFKKEAGQEVASIRSSVRNATVVIELKLKSTPISIHTANTNSHHANCGVPILNSGKVARVLVFTCLEEKDHIRIFNLLKDLNFDGAAFSINQMSQDEPFWQHSDQRHRVSINNQIHEQHIDQARLLKDAWEEIVGQASVNGESPGKLSSAENKDTKAGNTALNGENYSGGDDTSEASSNQHSGSSYANGNDTTTNVKTHMFECALQALVWAKQGKDHKWQSLWLHHESFYHQHQR